MRILVIEDEPKLADYLKKGLSEQSHVVDLARDGVDGLHLALEGAYDLIVLDVMLPGVDGFGILASVRAQKDTPILMLTARDAVEDRVRGLEGGADDYLVKPFAFSELLARVQALLRRGRTQEPTLLRLADLELDLARRRAQRGGRRLDLTAKEFSLLALLLRRQGQQRGLVGLERDAAQARHLPAVQAGDGQGLVDRALQRGQRGAAVAADAQGHLHAAASVVASLPAGSGGRYTTSRSCSVCQSVSSTGRWVIHSTAR